MSLCIAFKAEWSSFFYKKKLFSYRAKYMIYFYRTIPYPTFPIRFQLL